MKRSASTSGQAMEFWVATIVFGGLCSSVAWIDWRTMRIPDVLNALIFSSGGIAVVTLDHMTMNWALASAAGSFLLVYSVRAAFWWWKGEIGLGLGDVKFVGAVGPWLGLENLSTLLLTASITALAWVGCQRLLDRAVDGRTKIPFGPYLAIAAWATWLLRAAAIGG
jgi:leader peptidase (prepilin peptidase)/N-methyltransferase